MSIILNYLSSGLQMRLSVETESVGRITRDPPSRFEHVESGTREPRHLSAFLKGRDGVRE